MPAVVLVLATVSALAGTSAGRLTGNRHNSGPTTIGVNIQPALRQIGGVYFNGVNQSQVWMNIEPRLAGSSVAPVVLNLTVAFSGRRLDRAPRAVTLRAEPAWGAFPLLIRQPILRIVANRTATIDLTSAGSNYFVTASAGSGPANTIVADLPLESLRRMAQATDVTADTLGFTLRLSAADLAAWRAFLEAIEGGVVVRPN
jgi:hypothetical protein